MNKIRFCQIKLKPADTIPHYRLILYIKRTSLVNKKIIILVFVLNIYYNYTIYWVVLFNAQLEHFKEGWLCSE